MSPEKVFRLGPWGVAVALLLGCSAYASDPALAQAAPTLNPEQTVSPSPPKGPTGTKGSTIRESAERQSAAPNGLVKQTSPVRDPNTIGIVAGEPEGGALLFVNEVARVLATGQETGPSGELALRVLPIVGRGGIHDIRDILSLPGVDMGIVQERLLTRLQESKELGDVSNKLVYVAKLFNEDVHLVARSDIRHVSDLMGKPVNFSAYDSSVEGVARDLFRILKIPVEEVHLGQAEALEKMRKGEIAATVFLGFKSTAALERVTRGGEFRLLSIPFPVEATSYLPTTLRHDDYPGLIPAGEIVDTVAVGNVLLAYNWPEKNPRHRLLQSFVDAFFSRFSEFQTASPYPYWQEINLAAILPEWKRFKPAEQWLQRHETALKNHKEQAEEARAAADTLPSRTETTGSVAPEQDADVRLRNLFEEFLAWRERQKALRSAQ